MAEHCRHQPHLLPSGLPGHPMTPLFYPNPNDQLGLLRHHCSNAPLNFHSSVGGNSPSFEPITAQPRFPSFPDFSSLPYCPLARKQFAWPPAIWLGPNSHLPCQHCRLLDSDARGPAALFRKRRSPVHENLTLMLLLQHPSSCCCRYLVAKLCSALLKPLGLEPARLLCPWDFPDQNTGVICHFLQGIFPTQGSVPCLLLAGGFFTTEPQGKPFSS